MIKKPKLKPKAGDFEVPKAGKGGLNADIVGSHPTAIIAKAPCGKLGIGSLAMVTLLASFIFTSLFLTHLNADESNIAILIITSIIAVGLWIATMIIGSKYKHKHLFAGLAQQAAISLTAFAIIAGLYFVFAFVFVL